MFWQLSVHPQTCPKGRGKPAPRTSIVNYADYQIVATFGAEYRGLVQYKRDNPSPRGRN